MSISLRGSSFDVDLNDDDNSNDEHDNDHYDDYEYDTCERGRYEPYYSNRG